MDQLDLRIFRSMRFVPFGEDSADMSRLSPWVIAKRLGVDGKTVKARLERMKENGFIRYFQIYPNFRLLGLSGIAYLFDVGDVMKKYEMIDKCSLVDGVVEIHNFVGSEFCIDFAYQDTRDERRRLELIEKLTQCDSPTRFYERYMPATEVALSGTDWRIIKALRYDAFRPLSGVAKELGLTAKTVGRRFERMARNNAMIIFPVINPGVVPDAINYMILVYPYADRWDAALKGVMRTLDNCYLPSQPHRGGNVAILFRARTFAETEDNLIKVRRIEGVKDAKLLVLKETRECTQWLDAMIDKNIGEAGGEGAGPREVPESSGTALVDQATDRFKPS